MAISYDRVMVTPVDFNIFKYNYNSDPYRFEYNIGMDTRNPHAALPAYLNSSVFHKMLALGYNHLDLRDTYGVIIGSLDISGNYDIKYVAAVTELVGATHYSDKAYDATSYPNYPEGYTWGMKYKAAIPDLYDPLWFSVTLNGEVIERRMIDDEEIILEIGDYFSNDGDFPIEFMWNMASRYSYSICIQTRTYHGVTHDYLVLSTFSWYEDSHNNESLEYASIFLDSTFYENHICDGLSLEDFIIPEEGYVNELLNRFSPRFWTNCVGMYMIPASTGSDRSGIESVMKMLQEFDISDKLVNSWVGTDGKEYVINLRWYFGLNNSEYVKKAVDRVAMQIGTVLPTAVPVVPGEDPTYYYEDVAISEFAVWHTSELFVAPHFDNYLDMLTSYQLYLPYYGFLSLDPNDVVGARLKVYYNINLFTGHCDIIVTTKSSRTNNKEEKTYSVSCVVGEDIPFTTEMYQSMGLILGQRIKEAAGVLSSYAKGDMKGMLDAVGLDSSNAKSCKIDTGTDDVDDSSDKTSTLNQVINVANSVLGTTPKPTPTPARSGNFSAETGTLEDLFPYLLVTRPISAAPSNYEEYGGIPSFKSANLGSISGFTKIAAVAPSSMADAPKYVNEIISLLQAGVYL